MDPVKQLSNIIRLSLQENSLDTLDKYLASLKNSKDLLNSELILVLNQILKENGKHEKKTLAISSVVNCLHHFLSTVEVKDPRKWEKVSEDLSKLCARVFASSSYHIKDESLIQRVITLTSEIVDGKNSLTDDLLRFMIKTLLECSLCKTFTKYTRLLIMILIGSLLQKSSRRIRTEILPSTIDYLNELSNTLTESDDYETQISVVEILARSLTFIDEEKQISLFMNNPEIREMYKHFHPFLNFDPDCRLFLNKVNESLGARQKVFSVPCMVVIADGNQLRKPDDPSYSSFWVDFSVGSRSISFYYQPRRAESWELMTVPEDKVISAVAKDSACKSRSGEKFEAVKIELTIDSSEQSQTTELPQNLKIYPQKDKYIVIEHIIKKIFNGKYQTEMGCNEKQMRGTHNKHCEEANDTAKEKSFTEMSVPSKFPEKINEKDDKIFHKSQVIQPSEEERNEEDNVEDTPYLVGKMIEDEKTKPIPNRLQDIKDTAGKNIIQNSKYYSNKKLDRFGNEKSPYTQKQSPNGDDVRKNIPLHVHSSTDSSLKPMDTALEEVKQSNISADVDSQKPPNRVKRQTDHELNSNTKKKRLYSIEKSNAEDVVMSSQDQVLSIQIPSYKISKKETLVKPKPNVDRKNISYSYIANKEKISPTANTKVAPQKQLDFEDSLEAQTLGVSDDDKSESSGKSSPHALFKDLQEKSKSPCLAQSNKKRLFPDKTNENIPKTKSYVKSASSDSSSPERKNCKKLDKTYSKPKPKRASKKLKATPIVSSESSDSGSEYVPSSKVLKEINEEKNKKSPIKATFSDRVFNDKVDPTHDNIYVDNVEINKLNSNSKKKHLYSIEKGSVEDAVMSSQDQILSVQIPSNKISKKETLFKPKPNVDRKNISYSYIANKEKINPTANTKVAPQKQLDFEDSLEAQTLGASDDDKSESSDKSSPHALFKDLQEKSKLPSVAQSNKKRFFPDKTNKNIPKTKSYVKSAFLGFSSPEIRNCKKLDKTYSRPKPKRAWKKLKVPPIVSSESSDSGSEYVPSSKVFKENNEEKNKKSSTKTRFANRVFNDKVDPTRDNIYVDNVELKVTNDFEGLKIKPRDTPPLFNQENLSGKITAKVGPGKNTNSVKRKATKPASGKNQKKPEPNSPKILSEELSDVMDVVNYEPPDEYYTPEWEDLELDILSCNDNQQKALLLNATFKATDMVQFGRLLVKQVQEKITAAERLVQKERETNFATFYCNLQESCQKLYGNSKKMESVTGELEKLNTMVQEIYKLHKDIAAHTNSEALKIEEAKKEFLKNATEIKKTELSSISSIFRGVGGYLKTLVLSFTKGNHTKEKGNRAITD